MSSILIWTGAALLALALVLRAGKRIRHYFRRQELRRRMWILMDAGKEEARRSGVQRW